MAISANALSGKNGANRPARTSNTTPSGSNKEHKATFFDANRTYVEDGKNDLEHMDDAEFRMLLAAFYSEVPDRHFTLDDRVLHVNALIAATATRRAQGFPTLRIDAEGERLIIRRSAS